MTEPMGVYGPATSQVRQTDKITALSQREQLVSRMLPALRLVNLDTKIGPVTRLQIHFFILTVNHVMKGCAWHQY
jgi:hypothetical protein